MNPTFRDGENPRPAERRRLIFVRKQWTGGSGWSDAIEKFYEGVASLFSGAARLDVSVCSRKAVLAANSALRGMTANDADLSSVVVLVNHSICWWALSPTLIKLKRRGATICLCMHEHEHILGMGFVLRNLRNFRPKEMLRYSRLFHRIPASLSTRVLVLAEAQASVLGIADAIRTSYLPVDGRMFPAHWPPPRKQDAPVVVLFAHDPSRFDKGHRFVTLARALVSQTLEFSYGRQSDLPFDQVYTKYWRCDVLFLPSDWESFSLVLIEALACNKVIVSSERVGAVRLLLAKYSLEELEAFGLYVSSHDALAYAQQLDRAAVRVTRNDAPTTRELFDEFGFELVTLPTALL